MESLREWVRFASAKGALKGSFGEAMDALETVISCYRYVNDFGAYVGFPCKKNGRQECAENDEDGNNGTSVVNITGGARSSEVGEANENLSTEEVRVPKAIEASPDRQNEALVVNGNTVGNDGLDAVTGTGSTLENAGPSSNRERLLGKVLIFFDAAFNDKIYLMLSLPFMNELDSGFDLVAAGFRSKLGAREPVVPPLVKEVLTFCYWRHFKVLDEEKHRKRQRLLKTLQEMFTMARAFGLKTVDDLLFSFRRKQPESGNSPSPPASRCINCASEINSEQAIPSRTTRGITARRALEFNPQEQGNEASDMQTFATLRNGRNTKMRQSGRSTIVERDEQERTQSEENQNIRERLERNERQGRISSFQEMDNQQQRRNAQEHQPDEARESGDAIQQSAADRMEDGPAGISPVHGNNDRADEQSQPRQETGLRSGCSRAQNVIETCGSQRPSPHSRGENRLEVRIANGNSGVLGGSQAASRSGMRPQEAIGQFEEGRASQHPGRQAEPQELEQEGRRETPRNGDGQNTLILPTVPQESHMQQFQQPNFRSFENHGGQGDRNFMRSVQNILQPPLQRAAHAESLQNQEPHFNQGGPLLQAPYHPPRIDSHVQFQRVEYGQEYFALNSLQAHGHESLLQPVNSLNVLPEHGIAPAVFHQAELQRAHLRP